MISSSSPEEIHYSPLDLGQAVLVDGLAGRAQVPLGERAPELGDGGLVGLLFEGPPYPTGAHPGVAEQGVGRAAHRRDDDGHGPLPGGLGGDAGGADELGAAPDRGAPELYDEGSLQ